MDMDLDDEDLRSRIESLSGRIERHKHAEQTGYGRQPYPHLWRPQRGTPYGGHPGSGTSSPVHRNKTLVIKQEGPQDLVDDDSDMEEGELPQWIRKDDRHLQLINTSVYNKQNLQRTTAIERTRKEKSKKQQNQEKTMIASHVQTAAQGQAHLWTHPTADPAKYLTVNDIRFLVADGGNRLIKTDDETNKYFTTPKQTEVGGVMFYRSKNGNLYRGGLVHLYREHAGVTKSHKPCLHFSTTGSCPKGPSCRYIHNPDRVAMCKEYLKKGECRAGDYCDLSHNPTAERVPACLHFLRGSCTNPNCRYAHVRVNPGASVCKPFAIYGFCPRGSTCPQRHMHECPDYANKGTCRNEQCHMPHVDRAGRLRNAAKLEEDGRSDISSDTANDSEDVDSDELDEELLTLERDRDHEMAQQTDFVHL